MRIYGKRREIAEHYYEYDYKEYREDGTLKCTGTEDFSSQRLRSLEHRFIYTWDGEKRNKGGYRWFDFIGSVTILEGDLKELKKIVAKWHPEATIIQARLS